MRTRTPEPEVALAGRFVAGSFTNSAGTRAYRLYVPSGAAGRALPLLVMLHGCTQNAEDLAAGTRMNELAESGGFLVVYLEQSAKANGQRCLNWFKAEDQRRERGEPSIIAGITRQVAATQPVDTKRIYVAGMSAGGAMAVVMGATYPAQGKTAPRRTLERWTSRAVPTIVFYGDRDGTVHPRNGEQVLHQWAGNSSRGRCAGARSQAGARTPAPSTATLADGRSRSAGSYTGPATPGQAGASAARTPPPRGHDASAEMVRFFLEHPRG
jgi:poly(3-hydroxybutyrate) depolymerase